MKNGHTPGPWIVGPEIIDSDESPDYLRVTTKDCDIASRILLEADARLIAAAPDLLAALVEMLDLREAALRSEVTERHAADIVKDAIAAIAKARGEA